MFVTIVDDFSKMSWIFLIKHKSEFTKVFKQFAVFIENQLDTKIKCVRTDNADELTKGEALKFYRTHGIKLQTSCTETPQQNCIVERKLKHILETVRTLLFQANL